MTIMKPKATQTREARERLLGNINQLEELGYTQAQIGEVVEDYKQVVSSIKTNETYPISAKKANIFSDKIEAFIEKMPKENITNKD